MNHSASGLLALAVCSIAADILVDATPHLAERDGTSRWRDRKRMEKKECIVASLERESETRAGRNRYLRSRYPPSMGLVGRSLFIGAMSERERKVKPNFSRIIERIFAVFGRATRE
jgi:hypothetical protein